MSFWVYLKDEQGDSVEVERFSEGGTYVLGGTTAAELNITYNYSGDIYKAFEKFAPTLYYNAYAEEIKEKGLRFLDGKKAEFVTPLLAAAVEDLGTDQAQDYWSATPGNAGYALNILLSWARQYPQAVILVS